MPTYQELRSSCIAGINGDTDGATTTRYYYSQTNSESKITRPMICFFLLSITGED